MSWDDLLSAASTAREHAYAPYSRFQVGAALRFEDGSIHAGCNVENRSFGATICAERVALTGAVARGLRRPRAVVVVTATDPPSLPCGLCLQALAEFAGPELPLLLANPDGGRREFKLGELLPHPFVFPDEAGE